MTAGKWKVDSYVDFMGRRKWQVWHPRGWLDGVFLDPILAFHQLNRRLNGDNR